MPVYKMLRKKSILPVTACSVLLLLILPVLSACAVGGDAKDGTQTLSNDLNSEPAQSKSKSPDEMYRIMAAELEGSEGDVKKALTDYLEAALLSDDPAVAKRATVLSVRAGSWQNAAMAADRWLLLDPTNLEAMKALASAHLASGNYKAAAYQLDQLYEQTPGSSKDKWGQVIIVLSRAGNDEKARELLQKMLDTHGLSGDEKSIAEGKLAQSQLAIKLGNHQLAITLAKEAAAILQLDIDAQLWAGRIMMADANLPEASRYFKRAWEIDPQNLEAGMAYAEILHRQKNSLSANAVLADLEQTDQVILNRMVFAVLEKDLERAKEIYARMDKSTNKNDQGHAMRMARAADLVLLEDDARKWYALVPESERGWLAARLRLAVLLTESEGLEAGRAILKPLKNADREEVVEQAWLADSQILQKAGKLSESIHSLKQGLAILPDSVPLNYSLGIILAQVKDAPGSEVALRKVLSLQPDNPAALNALGYTLTDLSGRNEEALEYINRALEISPDDVSTLDSMGWVLFKLGRNDESLEYLKRAYKIEQIPEITAHLIEVLWVMGKKAEARQLYSISVERNADPLLKSTAQRLGL